MTTIKYLLLLILTVLVAALAYMNQEYFMAKTALTFNVKDTVYTLPELPNLAFWGICFFIGLVWSGIGILSTRFALKRIIREKDERIQTLSSKARALQTELEVFIHDPYIKKGRPAAAPEKTQEMIPAEEQPDATAAPQTEPAPTVTGDDAESQSAPQEDKTE